MQMYVYLIHFKSKLHHAGHYIGFSKCLDFRIASHREGTGAKLIRAITRLGIPWIVIRTWTEDFEQFQACQAEEVDGALRLVYYSCKYVHSSAGQNIEGRWFIRDRIVSNRILPENVDK